MKKTKTLLSLLLVVSLLLVLLAGCGEKTGEGNTEPSVTPSTAPSTAEITDDTPFAFSEGIDENGFWEGIKALDYVELFTYKGMHIPAEAHTVTDEAIQSEIDTIMADYVTSEQITDRAVADKDTVNIDYVGSVDGVEFEGGSTGGEGTEVIIGTTTYVDDFLEQLIGHKPGDKFDVNVTFPDDYSEETLQGKDAVFATTINHIVKQTTPELTDAFVAENLAETYGWTTAAAMKTGIKENLQKSSVQNYIGDFFTTGVTVSSVPERLTKYQERAMINYYQQFADQYEMTLDAFLLEQVGVESKDALIAQEADNNLQAAKYYFVCQAVAEDMNLTITKEDMDTYFIEVMDTEDYTEYEDQYGLPYLKQAVMVQKVMDYIMDNAIFD